MIRLLAIYFASGLGAVAVEAVWMRWLRELLGATAPAASATLVAFFAGHALGALWSVRAMRGAARPLALYGRLEIAAALGALAVPLLLGIGERALGAVYDGVRGAPAALTSLRFAIALGATLPAAFCFGATFAAIAGAAVAASRDLGSRGGALYAVNTTGAALGTALAVFVLPAWIGVPATYAAALAALVMAGAAALFLQFRVDRAAREARAHASAGAEGGGARSEAKSSEPSEAHQARAPKSIQLLGSSGSTPDDPTPPRSHDQPKHALQSSLTPLALLSGFAAFALQVLLVQAFAQVSNQSVYAFGAVLIVVLLAIAAAAATLSFLEHRDRLDARALLGAALVAGALAVAAFPAWLARTTGAFAYVGGTGGGYAYLGAMLATALVAAGPSLFAASLVFPAVFAAAGRREAAPPGAVLGGLVAANTLGAIAGAVAAPYALIPSLGLWPAFAALSALYGAAALLPLDTGGRRRIARAAALGGGWLGIAAVANPLAVPPVALAPGEALLDVESTPAAVVAVVERDGERLIRIDNHYALGGTAEGVHQERQAHLPLLLAPHAKRVAWAGSATGISAGGALVHPIDSLHLIELVPGVARAAERWFGEANRGVHRDPRSRVVVDDARNFLRWTGARFDVVVGDLFVPWQAGAGSLYTSEHFEAVRARLEPGGLFCQWLPLYQLSERELASIAATFHSVFPRTAVFRGDFYGRFPIAALVGFRDAPAPTDAIAAAARRLGAAGVRDRWVTDPNAWPALYVGALDAVAGELERAPRNSDAHPYIEREAAATHAGGRRGKLDPIVGERWVALAERLQAGGDDLFALDAEQQRTRAGGAALQAAGALYVNGQHEAAARAFARAAALLPARLVADAPADPTAAELWQER